MKRKGLSIILCVALVFTMVPINTFAAGKKYVKSFSMSSINISIEKGKTKTITAKVTVKNKASKKVSISSTSSKIKVTKGSPSSKGVTKIKVKALKTGSASFKVKTVAKNNKGKIVSKTVHVQVYEDEPEEEEESEEEADLSGEGGGSSGGTGVVNPPQDTNASSAQLESIKAAADAFTNKWYPTVKSECLTIASDCTTYTNVTERKQRWVYDALVDLIRNQVTGAPERVSQYKIKCEIFSEGDNSISCTTSTGVAKIGINLIRNAILKNETIYRTFDEFKTVCSSGPAKLIIESLDGFNVIPTQITAVTKIANNDFNSLSNAMKVYALAQSQYFGCFFAGDFAPTDFHMVYNYSKASSSYSGIEGTSLSLKEVFLSGNLVSYTIKSQDVNYFIDLLTKLKNNTATGVCRDYASYEYVYFKALGIDVWRNSSVSLNHEWTVVKVNNSSGKELWIPFDYGIGPSVAPDAWATYYNGIPGAPSTKGYQDSDFN